MISVNEIGKMKSHRSMTSSLSSFKDTSFKEDNFNICSRRATGMPHHRTTAAPGWASQSAGCGGARWSGWGPFLRVTASVVTPLTATVHRWGWGWGWRESETRAGPVSIPAIVFDHVRQFYDVLALLVLLTRLKGMFLQNKKVKY